MTETICNTCLTSSWSKEFCKWALGPLGRSALFPFRDKTASVEQYCCESTFEEMKNFIIFNGIAKSHRLSKYWVGCIVLNWVALHLALYDTMVSTFYSSCHQNCHRIDYIVYTLTIFLRSVSVATIILDLLLLFSTKMTVVVN